MSNIKLLRLCDNHKPNLASPDRISDQMPASTHVSDGYYHNHHSLSATQVTGEFEYRKVHPMDIWSGFLHDASDHQIHSAHDFHTSLISELRHHITLVGNKLDRERFPMIDIIGDVVHQYIRDRHVAANLGHQQNITRYLLQALTTLMAYSILSVPEVMTAQIHHDHHYHHHHGGYQRTAMPVSFEASAWAPTPEHIRQASSLDRIISPPQT